MKHNSMNIHDQFASEYDKAVSEYESYGAEILFGLSYEFVKPREHLIDIGIGTGLSSVPFAKAGLNVAGIDGSAAMLEICRAKGIATALELHDLQATPWPYSDLAYDHAIACGLLHFFGNLSFVFAEIGRLLKTNGVFAFTFLTQTQNEAVSSGGSDFHELSRSGVSIFAHSQEYITSLLNMSGFKTVKRVKYAVPGREQHPDDWFYAYLARKLGR